MIKINRKIAIITVFSAIIITLLVGITSIITSMYVINKEATANLKLLTHNKAHIIEEAFGKIETSTDNLSDYIEISFSPEKLNKYGINYLENYTESLIPLVKDFTANTDKVMTCYFNFDPNIVKSDKVYETWVYNKSESNKDYNVGLTEPRSNYYPEDRPELEWYYKPKNTGKSTWTNIYVDQILNVSMISYIRPLYVQKKFIGTAGMDMSIEDLKNMILELKVYETGYAFLMNDNLDMIIHKKYKTHENLKEINFFLYNAIKEKYKKKDMEIINYKHDGLQKICCYKKLSNGLIFVIAVPRAEILRQKFNLQLLVIGISLLSMILAIIIMINKE